MIKTILVTGGSGFIGTNFIYYLMNKTDYLIINYDNLTYASSIHSLKSLEKNKRYNFIKGDISNGNAFRQCLYDYKPDFIVNFAAESHVDRSIDVPFTFLQTNIIGTAVILDCIKDYLKKHKIKKESFRFLHISTDEVYGSLNKELFTELTPYNPSSPYSASKASSDHLVRAWNNTYDIPTLITNCSNNYGPYQFPEKLIPLMIVNCLNEQKLPVYGTGNNVRDWLYVNDHCSAIDKVLHNGKIGETYNIGGNCEMENLEIVKIICDILDKCHPRSENKSYNDLIKFVEDRPGHDFRYSVDTTKINKELNWKPEESFSSGILKTIDWYIENNKWLSYISHYKQERLGTV